MDFAKLIQMIANMVLRRGVNMAMKKGMDHFSRGQSQGQSQGQGYGPQGQGKDMARKARQAARAARRLGR